MTGLLLATTQNGASCSAHFALMRTTPVVLDHLRHNVKQQPFEHEQNVMLSAHYVNMCLPCFKLKIA
jgi:hypothetical protein